MPLRRRQIAGRVKADIAEGKYPVGSALPPVKQLAELLNTSYVTVIKGLKELERDGVIECRHGVGNFVKSKTGKSDGGSKLLCILHSGQDNKLKTNHQPGVQEQILEKCIEKFQLAGWAVTFFPVSIGKEQQLIEYASNKSIYFMLMALRPFGCLEEVLLKLAPKHMISIGEVFEKMPSVTSDENQVMKLLLEHLVDGGRSRIAFVCANLASPMELERAGVWRSFCYYQGMDANWSRDYLFNMEMPEYGAPDVYVSKMYEKMKTDGKLELLQGIITPDGEIAALLMGLLMDDGYRIPEDMAIASASMDSLSTIFRPQITSVDVDVEAHAQMALNIMESLAQGQDEPPMHYVCRPRLRVRGSTKNKIHFETK